MKKYLGIDYGSKNVGLSVSDDEGLMAFPLEVLPNDPALAEKIKKICAERKIEAVVVGESLDYSGKENPVMKKIRPFAEKLKAETGLPIFFEPEFLTSREAGHIQGENGKADASAAALILKSYLDKKSQNETQNKTQDKAENKTMNEEKISIDDFVKVKIKIGKILSAEKVPETDKLIKLSVDLGEGAPRQILSGIAEHYPDHSVLVGRLVPVITNLAPRVIRGHESNGMVLYAAGKDFLVTVSPERDIPEGTEIR